MKLYGTPPSHFTRKIRVLLYELGLKHDFIVLDKLKEVGPQYFANNPLHQIPVLEDGKEWIIESDTICTYLIEKYGKGQISFIPETEKKWSDHNRLAIINGAMDSGVKLIRAQRSEIPNYMDFVFFKQERGAFDASLAWLESDLGARKEYHPGQTTMLEITLMCLLEWAVFREFLPSLDPYPNLKSFVEFHQNRPMFKETHPGKAV